MRSLILSLVFVSIASGLFIPDCSDAAQIQVGPGLVVDFNFVNPHPLVTPNETARIYATLTNSPSSTKDFTQTNFFGYGFVVGDLINQDGVSSGFYNITSTQVPDLQGQTISPGATASFVFLDLTPVSPPIPASTYRTPSFGVYFSPDGYAASSQFFESPLSVTVTSNLWVPIGPEGKTINTVAINPNDPATLYAGTSGGVFKSADSGTNWQAVNAGLTSA